MRNGELMIDGKLFTVKFEIDGVSVGWHADYYMDRPEVTAQMIADSIARDVLIQLEGV